MTVSEHIRESGDVELSVMIAFCIVEYLQQSDMSNVRRYTQLKYIYTSMRMNWTKSIKMWPELSLS